MKSIIRGVVMVGVLLAAAESSHAAPPFALPGRTISVLNGFPWTLPQTNYHYVLTTDGTDGSEGTNGGPGGNNLGIASWHNYAQYASVTITGSIPAGGLNLWSHNSFLQIGLIGKNHAQYAANSYLSYMLQNSVYMMIVNESGQYRVLVGDKNDRTSSPNWLVFDRTQPLQYEFVVDNIAKTGKVRIDNGAGWSSWISVGFGLGASGPDNLQEAALIVQLMKIDNAIGTASVTLGDVTVDVEAANVLKLDVDTPSRYVRPGETLMVDMNVANLAQMINGCQALLGFSSTYLTAGPGCVVPGGGVWTELIYNSWDVGRGVPGEIDTAIGVKLGTGGDLGPVGTNADGKVAILSLTAGVTEGTAQVVFRPDGESGYATMFSDLNAQPVWPNKVNSASIVIDGTPPVLVTVPADGTTTAVTVAQQTITGTVSDNLAGLETLTCSFNGGPATAVPVTAGAFSQLVTLVPGANTAVFTATDKAGNVATSTVSFAYTQLAPTVEVFRSLAPNKYGSPSWGTWLANAVEGAKSRSAQGSGYTRFEDFGNASQDYSSVMVSASHSWQGLLSADPECGTAIHFVWRLDNGVQSNPGAAKLDVTGINITFNDIWLGADGAAGDLTTDYSSWWNGIVAGASFGGTSGFRSGLKGFDWDGSQWVSVTSGTQADLIIYAWFRYAQEPQGNPPTPDQEVLNTLYKQMSGAAAFSGDPRRTLDRQELEVRYTGHAGVGDGTSGSLTTAYKSADTTAPVVTITAPADGAEVKVAGQIITGSVTDAEVLASGVREVTITLNSGVVYSSTTADPVSFSQAVTLIEGDNTITVAAEDFAGNTASRTIHVYLDTVAPVLTIDSAVQGGNELLISLGSTTNAVQGTVTITVSSSDASPSAGLVVPPVVKVTDANGVETVPTAAGSGPWTYTYAVTPATANGIAAISAAISDEVGNSSSASDTFRVNKNQVTGQVQLQSFTGTGTSPLHARVVKFVATGGVASKEWTLALSNVSGAIFDYTLTDVPAGTTGLSADTAWSLRSKLVVALNMDGQATATFTGTEMLLGGDLNNDNIVNILDYSALKAKWFTTAPEADINGDGLSNTLDYSIQKANWFLRGDAE